MKNLSKFWKVSFALLVMTLLLTQSCNEADKSVLPEINSELSKKSMNWDSVDPLNVPDACKSVCLVAGQHMNVGSIDVAFEGGYLYVTYNIYEMGIFLEEVHLEIFSSEQELKDSKKISGGGAIPGKFDYQMQWNTEDMVVSHSVKIPEIDLPENDCFFIASHAALSNGETAWGGICNESEKGVTLVNALQFPGKNWSVYFEFCKDECQPSPIDFTYAWEDLLDDNNDADYNDLVVKSDVKKTSDKLEIDFFAVARGAAYDHEFKIKIPKSGVLSISGDEGYSEDDNYFYITVFASTKDALDEFVGGYAANTFATDETCEPTATAQLMLGIDGSFVFDETKPFEPFITVYPSGVVGDGNHYDLYIWEVSGVSTWSDGEDTTYPNGILIPDDWQWPVERQAIMGPYPNFVSIEDGYPLANWGDTPVNPGQVWSCAP